jgi:hypothetical protein
LTTKDGINALMHNFISTLRIYIYRCTRCLYSSREGFQTLHEEKYEVSRIVFSWVVDCRRSRFCCRLQLGNEMPSIDDLTRLFIHSGNLAQIFQVQAADWWSVFTRLLWVSMPRLWLYVAGLPPNILLNPKTQLKKDH